MSFVGHSIVVPLMDAELRYLDSIELGQGIRIISLPSEYRQRLGEDKVLVGGYQRSLNIMHVGLLFEPSISCPKKHLSLDDALLAVIFLSFSLRLAIEIPFDIPFWFDISVNNDISVVGRTLIRTFRSLPRYSYPLDEGLTYERINSFLPYSIPLLERYIEFPDSDRLIKAIEFSAIGFQTRHIPMRLVNQVMFMEILFSSDIQELSFQLSSRISWYLRHSYSPEEREEFFKKIKKIYTMRSKIVHGDSPKKIKNLRTQMRQMLEEAESINSEIFREILGRNHIELFSASNREEHLQKLSLGLPCDYIKNRL